MSSNHYEGMFLVDSAKFATDADGVTNQILGILQKCGATIVAHRPWQDGRLAYAIEKQRKGLHYLVLFQLDPAQLTEVVRLCKLNETIIRQLIIRQPSIVFDAMVQALVNHTTQAPPEDVPEPEDDRPRRGGRPRRDRVEAAPDIDAAAEL